MILLNADPGESEFTIPSFGVAEKWQVMIDTSSAGSPKGPRRVSSGTKHVMTGRSLKVLKPIYTKKTERGIPTVKKTSR
jgi:hypothetical protein